MKKAYLRIQSRKESPIHRKNLGGIFHRSSGQIGGVTDVNVGVTAHQLAEGRVDRVRLVKVKVEPHDPA